MVKPEIIKNEKKLVIPGKKSMNKKTEPKENFHKVLKKKISTTRKNKISEKNKIEEKKHSIKKVNSAHKKVKKVLIEKIEKIKQEIVASLFVLKKENPELFKKIVKTYFKNSNLLEKQADIIEKLSSLGYRKLLRFLADIKNALTQFSAIKKVLKPDIKIDNKNKDNDSESSFVKEMKNKGKLVIENKKEAKSLNKIPINNLKDNQENFSVKNIFDRTSIHKINTPSITTNNKISEPAPKISSPLPKINLEDIFEQVVQKARITIMENKSEVLIKLKPEFLGRVVLRMELAGNKISGKILVDNAFTHRLFVENFSQLKVAFQEMGLSVENFDIGLSDYNNFNFSENRTGKTKTTGRTPFVEDINESLLEETIMSYETLDWIANNINLIA